jgi:hypothetical protein
VCHRHIFFTPRVQVESNRIIEGVIRSVRGYCTVLYCTVLYMQSVRSPKGGDRPVFVHDARVRVSSDLQIICFIDSNEDNI